MSNLTIVLIFYLLFEISYASFWPYHLTFENHPIRRDNKRLENIFTFNQDHDTTCETIKASENAIYEEANIDREEQEKAIANQFHGNRFTHFVQYTRHQEIAKALEASIISELICDPDDFHPVVTELEDDVRFSCSQMCQRCMPGSYPVCYMKSRLYPGVAQTCLCTYSHENPIQQAALSLKHSGFHVKKYYKPFKLIINKE